MAPSEDRGGLGGHGITVALALAGLVAAYAMFESMARELDAPPSPAPAAVQVDSFPGYRSLAHGVWLDARLYTRGDRLYVGRITSLACPDSAPIGALLGCLEIEFSDGHRAWVRWQQAVNQYLAGMPNRGS